LAKKPAVPHKEIVEYILSGHTTREAKGHFDFPSDNIANLRVHVAFKRLRIPRPRFQESRECEFCKTQFIARDLKQRTCGKEQCQTALIRAWQGENRGKVRDSLARYRKTSKGRSNNLRMHARRRERGTTGPLVEQWNFAAAETMKRLRKLKALNTRHAWEYRIQHIQKLTKLVRHFNPRRQRNVVGNGPKAWHHAMRAMQTTISQTNAREQESEWEAAVSGISAALKTGERMRTWKKKIS
jgi:hypothetical protein